MVEVEDKGAGVVLDAVGVDVVVELGFAVLVGWFGSCEEGEDEEEGYEEEKGYEECSEEGMFGFFCVGFAEDAVRAEFFAVDGA